MSEEEFGSYLMSEYIEEENKHNLEVQRINDRIFNAITNTLGSEFVDDLKYCMKDSEAKHFAMEFSRKPIGQYQRENYGKIKYLWVDQHGPVIDADDFYGTISIELKPFKYLIFNY